MSNNLSAALTAEFVGTFALIFIGAGSAALGIGGLVGVAFAHGLVLLAFAYAFGHISGTHINPAVTFGVWMAKKMDGGRAFSYIVFQLLGGIVGALALRLVLGGTQNNLGATVLVQGLEVGGGTVTISAGTGLFIEAVLTFFLVTVVLNTAISGEAGGHAGLAIGLTLTFCILLGGPLTGGSLNPARSLGPALASGVYPNLWVYFVGPLAGGAAAAILFRGVLEKSQ